MIWLNKLQIAIIEKNTDSLDALLDDLPEFKDVGEMKKASYLLIEASRLLHALRDDTSYQMRKIQKNLKFLNSTQAPIVSKLDITS